MNLGVSAPGITTPLKRRYPKLLIKRYNISRREDLPLPFFPTKAHRLILSPYKFISSVGLFE